jgi:hypothetical protein
MPGFIVNDVGGGSASRAAAGIKPVYNYTWDINSLFEDPINTTRLLAKDATMPTFTITKDTVDGSSLTYKYAGMVVWEDIKVTFYDVVLGGDSPGSIQLKASTIFKTWRETVWSNSTGLRSPSDYKKESKISTYTLDWQAETVWTLHGSWPSVVKEGDLTYTNTDIKVVEVTISYDWAVLDESPGTRQ